MATAYQHRPMSQILAPAADPRQEGQNSDQPRDSQGRFVSPDQSQASAQDQTQFQLPEKYQGKTVEQVAEMHINAEKELGRMRNEVGTYRGLVNDLTSLQRTAPASKPVERETIDVSGDQLLSDPSGTIDKIVTQRLKEHDAVAASPQPEPADTLFEIEGRSLLAAFPDLDTIVKSQEFVEFATRTPTRQADFNTAARGEGLDQVRAARRLLEDFTDFQSQTGTVIRSPEQQQVVTQQQPQQRVATPVQQARAASTEGAGPTGTISSEPLIYEADVIKLIHNDRAKYNSPSYQTELMKAMREGRYVKAG